MTSSLQSPIPLPSPWPKKTGPSFRNLCLADKLASELKLLLRRPLASPKTGSAGATASGEVVVLFETGAVGKEDEVVGARERKDVGGAIEEFIMDN